jgi:cbb3-type cytochrome oxidase maturation protein
VNILFLAVPITLILGIGFLAALFWAVQADQFEDLETPALRMLFESKLEKQHDQQESPSESAQTSS